MAAVFPGASRTMQDGRFGGTVLVSLSSAYFESFHKDLGADGPGQPRLQDVLLTDVVMPGEMDGVALAIVREPAEG